MTGDFKNTPYTDGMFVRYEDLISDPKDKLQEIADRFGYEWKGQFKNLFKVPMSSKFTEEKRQYYIRQKPKYGKDKINEINKVIDWELMEFYNYYPLSEE